MLAPLAIRGGEVVDAREEREVCDGDLRRGDAELVVQLPHRRALRSLDVAGQVAVARLRRVRQRVRAARVGPHVWERDFLARPLLEKQLFRLGVEEEYGEGAVEEALVDVGHQVACFLGRRADGLVVVVEHYAHFVHQPDLLLVVAGQVVRVRLPVAVRGDGVGCHLGPN